MNRNWHRTLPPLPKRRDTLWVDWVMPWIILLVSGFFMVWVLSQIMPYVPVLETPTGDAPSGTYQQGHPSLDKAWDDWHKAGNEAPKAWPEF